MRQALIINGHQKYETIAEGKLTKMYLDAAKLFLVENGFDVKFTNIEEGYDIEEELEKFSWAYHFIFQHPVYWMGMPWIAKKYIDEVFSAGQGKVTFENDGRSLKDPNLRYGSGGLMRGKKYMLSLTYNCPSSEFDNPAGFFNGKSVDEANIATHKIFQFCGATKLKTFSVHDVYKGDLDMIFEQEKFVKILSKNFL